MQSLAHPQHDVLPEHDFLIKPNGAMKSLDTTIMTRCVLPRGPGGAPKFGTDERRRQGFMALSTWRPGVHATTQSFQI